MFVSLLLETFCVEDFLNKDLWIQAKGRDELVLASFRDEFLVFTSHGQVKKDFEFISDARIHNIPKGYSVSFGVRSICNQRNKSAAQMCTSPRAVKAALSIIRKGYCYKIKNREGKCLGMGVPLNLSEIDTDSLMRDTKEGVDRVFTAEFQECIASDSQCLQFTPKMSKTSILASVNEAIDNVESQNPENPRISQKSKKTPSNYSEKEENQPDFDLRYVHEDIDAAHHALAQDDPESVLIYKHLIPQCFYGYTSMKMFLNDPLPNLRKLKQKYCVHNKLRRPSNIL